MVLCSQDCPRLQPHSTPRDRSELTHAELGKLRVLRGSALLLFHNARKAGLWNAVLCQGKEETSLQALSAPGVSPRRAHRAAVCPPRPCVRPPAQSSAHRVRVQPVRFPPGDPVPWGAALPLCCPGCSHRVRTAETLPMRKIPPVTHFSNTVTPPGPAPPET